MATFFDSRVSKFAIVYPGTATTDISAYIKSIDGLPGPRRLNNVTTFGSVGDRFSAGLQGTDITIEMIYSEDASVGTDTIFSPLRTTTSTVAFWFCPTGVTTARVYSGNLLMEDYVVKPLIGQAILATVKAKVDNGTT